MINAAVESATEAYADLSKEKKIRVLHVDNDAGFLAVAKQCLEEQGQFQVDTALSAKEALRKLGDTEYDAVIADYQMPGKNGLELLQELRQAGNDVPFILFTCKGKEEFEIDALNSGVHQYIRKEGNAEVTYEELKNSIRGAVKKRMTERLLRESETRLRQITENIQDILILTDTNFTVTYASASLKWILGYEPNELIGKSIGHLIHPDDLERVTEIVKKALELRSGGKLETRAKHADGHYVLLEGIGKILTDENGKFTGTVLTCRDITERKKMEETLKGSEEKYRKLFEEAMDAILVADAETGILVDCNRAATELMGKSKSELIGAHQRSLHPENSKGKFSKAFEEHLSDKEGQPIEDKIITKNGQIKDVTIKGNRIEINGKKMLQGIFRDITESKRSLEKIIFQAHLLNAVGQAVIAADTDGRILYWNDAAEQLYGWSKTEVLGKNIIEIMLKEIDEQYPSEVVNHLKGGESWRGEVILKRRDGTMLQVIITTAPITNDKGEPIGILGISIDITEQKWMQQVLEDAIKAVAELNEKLRVVEGLTRHDVRNKLSALNGRLYLLKKRCNSNLEALQQITEIETISKQILRILEFEKIYVQVGSEELKYIDVETHINEAAALFSDLKGIQLVNDCHRLQVLADSLLRQLFYNLIDNTLKYGEKTRTIRIHYEEEKDQIKLIYEDDGVGIPEDVKVNLFQEGYGKGTGYGLYLIKRICDAYGWSIQETGVKNQGTRFTMTIPKNGKDDKEGYKIS